MVESVIDVEHEFLSGCQIDYNSIICGGNSKRIQLWDLRGKRALPNLIKLDSQLIQVCNMTRFTDNHILVSNINETYSLDLRNWSL